MAEKEFRMEKRSITTEALARWDADTFHLLYSHYYKALVNYAFQFVKDEDDAEDIVQGMFSEIWNQQVRFTSLFPLEVFLYNSVRNRSLNHLKHNQVKAAYIKDVASQLPAYQHDDDESLFTERAYRMLFESIDMLPPRSREVFLLYMKGKKNKEIAEVLDISVETVKTHKKRSMVFLRQALDGKQLMLLLYILHINMT